MRARLLTRLLPLLALGLLGCPPPATSPPPPRRPRRAPARPAQRAVRLASPEAYDQFLLAELARARGDLRAARRHLRRALSEDPGSPDLRVRLARLLLHEGQRAAALALLREASRIAPGHVPTLLLRARLMRRTAPERARSLLVQAQREAPQRPEVWLARARLERFLHHPQAEARAYERLLARRPDDPDGLFGLALLDWRRGAPRRAAALVDRVIQVQPFAVAPWLARARLWVGAGRPARAARVLLDGLEATADDLTVAEELFRLWMSQGRRDRARDLATLLQVHGSAPYLTAVAEWRARLGQWPAAMRLIAEARAQDPQYGPAVVRWARWRARREPGLRAERLLSRIPPRSRAFAQARVAAADLRAAQGDGAGAIHSLVRALRHRPSSPELWEALAFQRARLQRLPGALRALERSRKARHRSRQDPAHRYVRALVLEEAGQLRAALRLGRSLVRADPGDPELLNLLGYCLAERGLRLPEADRLLARAQRLDPLNPYILDSLGWARYQQRRLAAAIPLLERAVQIDGWLCEAWQHLGDARRAAGALTAAARAYRAARRCSSAPAVRAVLTGKLRELGRRIRRRAPGKNGASHRRRP